MQREMNELTSSIDNKRFIAILFIFAILIRASLPASAYLLRHDVSAFYSSDTQSFLKGARYILTDGLRTPELKRTPGYSLLLIPGLLINHVYIATLFFQLLLSGASVVVAYLIGRMVFDEKSARLGASLYAMEPNSVISSIFLLSDSSAVAILIFALYYLLLFLRSDRPKHLVACALFIAVDAYVRPSAQYLCVFFAILLLARTLGRKRDRFKFALLNCVILVIPVCLISLWSVRNWIVTGYPGFSTIQSSMIYEYYAPAIQAINERSNYLAESNKMKADLIAYMTKRHEISDQAKIARYQRSVGMKIVRSNMLAFVRIYAKGMMMTLMEPGAEYYLSIYKFHRESGLVGVIEDQGFLRGGIFILRREPALFFTSLAFGILLMISYVLSIIALLFGKFNIWDKLAFIITCSNYIIISGGPAAVSRFRWPIMPIVCLLTGYQLSMMLRMRYQDKRRIDAPAPI